jgi:hypothetical protein
MTNEILIAVLFVSYFQNRETSNPSPDQELALIVVTTNRPQTLSQLMERGEFFESSVESYTSQERKNLVSSTFRGGWLQGPPIGNRTRG